MSLLFNYYFGSDMYNSPESGSTTLTDQFTSGRTAANGTLRSGEESSAETSTPSAISDNYSVDSPYDGSGSSNNYGLNGGLGIMWQHIVLFRIQMITRQEKEDFIILIYLYFIKYFIYHMLLV